MAPSFISKMKRKRVEDGDNSKVLEDVILTVDIKYADSLDPNNVGHTAERRTYQVYGWTGTGAEFTTREVFGCPDPQWRRIYSMRHIRPASYLYLEVVRTGSTSDPGTSTGCVCVGRTRVPLPTVPNTVTGGRFGLVRLKDQGGVQCGCCAPSEPSIQPELCKCCVPPELSSAMKGRCSAPLTLIAEGHIQVSVEITKC